MVSQAVFLTFDYREFGLMAITGGAVPSQMTYMLPTSHQYKIMTASKLYSRETQFTEVKINSWL